ncbi:MAG: metal-dependent hydrolase [Clostridiales bacterium]|nr:metal-dependent hydrolase [Clostridiales bacterium]
MIIDFHTHVFPDQIAERTISHLARAGKETPAFNGTVQGLLAEMQKSGVDLSIILPVMTAPKQFESVNRFALALNNAEETRGKLISFAGIHPSCENLTEKMAWIKENGFLGVKIHPDYQGTFIDDDEYAEILQAAKKLDLIVITHAGVDGGFPNEPVRCTPDRVKNLLLKAPHEKFVLAHLGGNLMYDDVYDTLCGLNVYFDTAHVLSTIKKETFLRVVRKHGIHRVLFATDAPWSKQKEDISTLKSFGLTPKEEEQLFYKNAVSLLGLGENYGH